MESAPPAPARRSAGLPRRLRIRRTAEFRELRRRSRTFRTRDFIVAWAPGSQSSSRIGLTVSRKVGGSVVRNRVKRLLREWFRLHRQDLLESWDLVVIARQAGPEIGLSEVQRQLGEFVAWINRKASKGPALAVPDALEEQEG